MPSPIGNAADTFTDNININTKTPMRELTDHKVNEANEALKILVLDEPGAGGACHTYGIFAPQDVEANSSEPSKDGALALVANRCMVRFQNGPIKEAGVNGVTQEALLAICADRLRSFQAGPYSCRENAVALTHIETAQMWLQKRTRERLARGVEGTHTV